MSAQGAARQQPPAAPPSPGGARVPAPRPGLRGWWDRLQGPGSTPAESALTGLAALLGAVAVPLAVVLAGLDWSVLQLAVTAAVAFDVGGGISANAADGAKAWFHRPGRGARHHLLFVAAHGHPFLLAALFPGYGWAAATTAYLGILAAASLIVATPARLRRPVAFVLFGVVVVLSLYAGGAPPGLEWVVPLLALKLLLAHLLPESAAARP